MTVLRTGEGTDSAPIGTADICRVLVSLAIEERALLNQRSVPVGEWAIWDAATPIGEDGLGFDSIARLGFAARVSEFFRLHEIGSEDYLTLASTLGEWTGIVRESLESGTSGITFRTSGTSGIPKRCGHEWAALAEEVRSGATMAGTGRVLACVPAHHLYGFLFTVLGPRGLDRQVVDLRGRAMGAILRRAEPGDLIVATPYLWEQILAPGTCTGRGVFGVTSGGAAPLASWRAASEAGFSGFADVYGSSETGGLGIREDPGPEFTLLPHLERSPTGILRRSDKTVLVPPDAIEWSGAREFRVGPRRDGAIEIAGCNVYPTRVRDLLLLDPDVVDAAVRPDGETPRARLKAFVILRQDDRGSGREDVEVRLRSLCRDRLIPAERPQSFTFGPELPRGETGKLADWQVAEH